MKRSFRKITSIAVFCIVILVIAAGGVAAKLIYAGTPESANSLSFQGYILLPEGRMLTILDYLSVSGKSLFVADESTGKVYNVRLDGEGLPDALDVSVFALEPATHGVIIDPASRLGYVTRSDANTVDIFNPATMRLIKRIPVAADPDGIFYDPHNKLVYVASGDSGVGTVIDPATQTISAVIPLGGKPEFAAFDGQTNLLYQNIEDGDMIAVLDLAKRSVTQDWLLQGCKAPSGMAIDEPHRRLFVACSGNATLVVFDLDAHRVVASLPVGSSPDSVAFDPDLRRIYTTGRAGLLSVIQQDTSDSYRQLDAIHTHYGAHTLAIDPVTHRLYLGYASLLVQPRVAVFAARR
ncbi:MAG TPA: hypothetical protein VNT30_21320 [Stellaceae bacterium]|nr:hypothetical protein [Stellaceae bacterium]